MVIPLLSKMTVAPSGRGDFSSSNVGQCPSEREREREGEIEGADKTDLGGHGSHLRLGGRARGVYRQICVRRRRPSPLTAAHLTHLISALGEDGDMFGDDLHAWGMSEIYLTTGYSPDLAPNYLCSLTQSCF